MSYEKKWSYEVSQFTTSERLKQKRYRGTWRWNVGYMDNLMPSFPIFSVVQSSHDHKKLKLGNGFKGPVIATKAEAIKQAQIALADAKRKDAEKDQQKKH
jgi:hypothetical protein